MPGRTKANICLACAAIFVAAMITIYVFGATPDTSPASSHDHDAVPVIPAHEHPTDVPNWVMPLAIVVLGIVQLLIGVAIKATLNKYVTKEECHFMHRDTYRTEIKPLEEGAAARRERMQFLEQQLKDLAHHTEAQIVEINARLKLIEHNLQRLTFHLIGEAGLDIKGGD